MIYAETRVPLESLLPDQNVRVVTASDGRELVGRLELCLTSLTRMRGLIGHSPLGPDEGMLLVPCRGVHSFFMGYPIDVAFLDPSGRIIATRPNLRPWRLTPVFGDAMATLELSAGALASHGVAAGDVLAFEKITG